MNQIDIVEYAIRYCMGRRSYAFTDGLDLAESNWDDLSEATRSDVVHAVRLRGLERSTTKRFPKVTAAYKERYPQ